jgi:hypothetical protein
VEQKTDQHQKERQIREITGTYGLQQEEGVVGLKTDHAGESARKDRDSTKTPTNKNSKEEWLDWRRFRGWGSTKTDSQEKIGRREMKGNQRMKVAGPTPKVTKLKTHQAQ